MFVNLLKFMQIKFVRLPYKDCMLINKYLKRMVNKMEEKFREWVLKEGLKDSTTDKYISSLRTTIPGIASSAGITDCPTSLFEISELNKLKTIIEKLNSDKSYNDSNEDKHRVLSSALIKYEEFLMFLGTSSTYCASSTSSRFFYRNLIVVGAPGTGKSYILNEEKNKILASSTNNYERISFHPEYTYSQFVGTYKPKSNAGIITYEYVPGPFMRVLVEAYNNPDERHLLLIEEINRSNVAAVFGEVFQLLDRSSTGESVYPIKTSEDMREYLKSALVGSSVNVDEIIIPENMYIWATMNGADQGVLPMDTAFKRRWDFVRIGIDENADYNIEVNIHGETQKWNDIRVAINSKLLDCNVNEDKLLGPYFLSKSLLDRANSYAAKNPNTIDCDFDKIFKNKILMYLFDDAVKQKRLSFFGDRIKTFSDVCIDFDKYGWRI